MWLLMMLPALAGELQVSVDAGGETLELTLEDVAACAPQTVTLGTHAQSWELRARAWEQAPGEVLVQLWVRHEDHGRRGGVQEFEPSFLVVEGQAAELVVTDQVRVAVVASGFEAGGCEVRRERRERRETRTRREG